MNRPTLFYILLWLTIHLDSASSSEVGLPYCVKPSASNEVPFQPYINTLNLPLSWNGGVTYHLFAVSVCEPGELLQGDVSGGTNEERNENQVSGDCQQPSFVKQFASTRAMGEGAACLFTDSADEEQAPRCELSFDHQVQAAQWFPASGNSGNDIVTAKYASTAVNYTLLLIIECGSGGTSQGQVVVDFPPAQYNMTIFDATACDRIEPVWEVTPLELASMICGVAAIVGFVYHIAVGWFFHQRRGWALLHPRFVPPHGSSADVPNLESSTQENIVPALLPPAASLNVAATSAAPSA